MWLGSVVVLVLAVTSSFGSPLLNELKPGEEWPKRQSVKQPTHVDHDNSTNFTQNQEILVITSTQHSNEKNQEEIQQEDNTNFETKSANILIVEKSDKNENVDSPKEVEKINLEEESLPDSILHKSVQSSKSENIKVNYSGAQLWKVSTEKTGVRATLSRLNRRNLISTWGGNHTHIDVLIKSDAVKNVTRVFKRDNILYDIIIEDLQKTIEAENPPLDENEIELQDRRARAYNFWRYRANVQLLHYAGAYTGQYSLSIPMEYWPKANWGHRMTWNLYHRLEDIHGFMDYLAKTYPSFVSVQSIGKSHEGRELKLLIISNGKPNNKAVFIDGGIHAREWISPATVTFIINQFVEKFDEESDDIKNIDWHILPVLNPDGYEYTHTVDRLWRKNRKASNLLRSCFGTDLNRNFGYRWGGKGASRNPCSEIYCGTKAFSEPESEALSNYIKNNEGKFSAYITYHSYGQYLLYPWGYDNVVPPDYKDLDAVGKQIAQAIKETGGSTYSVGSSSGLLYPASGGSDDWAKSKGIKYAYTIELSDTGHYGFILPQKFIEPVAKENLAGLRVLAKQINSE